MSTTDLLQPLKKWESGKNIKICVGVDIGGSGARVRISNANNKNQYVDLPHISVQSTKDLVDSLANIQNALNKTLSAYESCGAALAVAGPIKNGTVILTNWPGKPEVRTLSLDHLPQKLFPKSKTAFLNDLEAGAYGIIAANELKIIDSYFVQLWTNVAQEGPIVSNERTAVMALGTGLGVALIVHSPMHKGPLVLPCELGHLQVPVVPEKDPESDEEYDLLRHVAKYYYNGEKTPEYEDLSSGRGIQLCYQFFLKRYKGVDKELDQIDAGEVAQSAQKGDKVAKSALFWCYKLYFRLAKSIATSLQCDSVIMALDNQVKNADFVETISNQMRLEFYNFIRPDWMKGIRVYSQTKILNFNILGCDYVAHHINSK